RRLHRLDTIQQALLSLSQACRYLRTNFSIQEDTSEAKAGHRDDPTYMRGSLINDQVRTRVYHDFAAAQYMGGGAVHSELDCKRRATLRPFDGGRFTLGE